MVRASNEFLKSGGKFFKQQDQKEKNLPRLAVKGANYLAARRIHRRAASKIKTGLSRIFFQKKLAKSAQILKSRQEKLLKFKINYIPLCSDEDWEAIAAFYSKNAE